MVPSTVTTMASHLGHRCRRRKENAGHTSAVTRIATSRGTTRSFSWMTRKITTPRAAAITSNRQAYAVA